MLWFLHASPLARSPVLAPLLAPLQALHCRMLRHRLESLAPAAREAALRAALFGRGGWDTCEQWRASHRLLGTVRALHLEVRMSVCA